MDRRGRGEELERGGKGERERGWIGGGGGRNWREGEGIILYYLLHFLTSTYFSFTEGRLVLSKTTALSPWSPGSAPSSGSTLSETEVKMA